MNTLIRSLSLVIIFCFGLALSSAVLAKDDKRKQGSEASSEHKSDSGLEHGNAYAGTKEKEEKETEAKDKSAKTKTDGKEKKAKDKRKKK